MQKIQILEIKTDKKQYIYGIDKEIRLSFFLQSKRRTSIKKENVYIEYGFYVFCREEKHVVKKSKLFLDHNLNLENGEQKEYSTTIPIEIANIKGGINKIECFGYIKAPGIGFKHNLDINIKFKYSAYKEYQIYNIIRSKSEISDTYNKKELSTLLRSMGFLFGGGVKSQLRDTLKVKDENKIKLKTKFNGFILPWFDLGIDTYDIVDRKLLNIIKEKSILFRLYHFLLNSKIVNTVYRYIILLPLGIMVLHSFDVFQLSFTSFNIFINCTLIGLPLVFFLARLIELHYTKIINQSIMDYQLFSKHDITDKINNLLEGGKLSIHDIFKKLTLLGDSKGNYNMSVILNGYLESHAGVGKNARQYVGYMYGVKLFDYSGKGELNLSNIKLLDNAYQKVRGILMPKFQSGWVNGVSKVYYKLHIVLTSDYFKDFETEFTIDVNKNLDGVGKADRIFKRFVIFSGIVVLIILFGLVGFLKF